MAFTDLIQDNIHQFNSTLFAVDSFSLFQQLLKLLCCFFIIRRNTLLGIPA